MLAGDLRPDEGALSYDGDIRVGILRQDVDFEDRHTLMGEIESSFTEIKAIEKRLEEVNHALESRTDYQSDGYMKLIEELNDLTHKYDLAGGYTYAGEVERVLLGLGFERSDFDKDTRLFSGGWRMRIELAKLLLGKDDILLLDEPTNHLDIESIIWLEDFLNRFPGGVVVVSHDRTFLDNITNRTIEISGGGYTTTNNLIPNTWNCGPRSGKNSSPRGKTRKRKSSRPNSSSNVSATKPPRRPLPRA